MALRRPADHTRMQTGTLPAQSQESSRWDWFCYCGRKTLSLSRGTRTQAGTSCPYVVRGVSNPPCPTAKVVHHLSSSTLRRSSWTRCLSTLSMFPATSLRISPITSVMSSSKVASEALCRNSKSLLKARMFSFKAPSLCFFQPHLALCGGLTPAISQVPTLILAHSHPHTGTGRN